jgi:exodeoxyribonuclease V alpha subunit
MNSSISIKLSDLLDSSYIDYIEYYIPTIYGKSDSSLKLCLCYLLKAVKMGNLCVIIEENKLSPKPETLFLDSDGKGLKSNIIIVIENQIREGFQALKSLKSNNPFWSIYKNSLYLKKTKYFENLFVDNFLRLISTEPALVFKPNQVDSEIREITKKINLNREQLKALKNTLNASVSLITGGPGTGKTFLTGLILKIYLSLFPLNRKARIAVTAPTGKAAQNIVTSLNKAGLNQEHLSPTTLHSLLGIKTGFTKYKQLNSLNFDLIVVDESSMLDYRLITQLLRKINKGTRILFLGDANQLPPVEAGNFFNIMAKLKLPCETYFNVSELKQCMRSDSESLNLMSNFVKDLKSNEFINLALETDSFLDEENFIDSKGFIKPKFLNFYPSHFSLPLGTIFNDFQNFRILSPLKKGKLGLERINNIYYKYFKTIAAQQEHFIVPIIISKNSPLTGLVNGESGLLVYSRKDKPYAYFQRPEGEIKIPKILLPSYDLSYCISIHKSQGSEYKNVLILLPDGSEVFGAEALYTAITRSKSSFKLISSQEVLKKVLSEKENRISGILDKILAS